MLDLKVPPVVVFMICLAGIFGCYYVLPEFNFHFAFRTTLSRVVLATGFLSGVLGVVAFKLKKTTVDPTHPEQASSLVTNGIYQYTRNPMYLGLALVLIGALVRIGNPIGLCFLVLFIWYMTRFQIKPEESILVQLFKDEYEAYRQKVRRWI